MEVYQKRFFTGKFKTKMDDLGGSFTGDSSVWLNWYEMICIIQDGKYHGMLGVIGNRIGDNCRNDWG